MIERGVCFDGAVRGRERLEEDAGMKEREGGVRVEEEEEELGMKEIRPM